MTERHIIEPHPDDKRYVRRDKDGQFSDEVDVGKSLAADERQHSGHKKPRNEGDRGD
ncbi:hypothetical protein [Sphingomonas sp.]|uniref:hypothetical protein n=1 Tax=Sphingomonas sp. TaxID=28214 RepID=UPI0025DF1235|nr:hypothetical protein [Sphingomonas sp.]